jgi:hypothetical protein
VSEQRETLVLDGDDASEAASGSDGENEEIVLTRVKQIAPKPAAAKRRKVEPTVIARLKASTSSRSSRIEKLGEGCAAWPLVLRDDHPSVSVAKHASLLSRRRNLEKLLFAVTDSLPETRQAAFGWLADALLAAEASIALRATHASIYHSLMVSLIQRIRRERSLRIILSTEHAQLFDQTIQQLKAGAADSSTATMASASAAAAATTNDAQNGRTS